MVFKSKFFQRVLGLVRRLLPLPRFDLFLQGTLLMLVFYEGLVYQLLKRSATANLIAYRSNDWVYMGAGGAEVLLGGVIGWAGSRRKQYALSGWLAAAGLCGLLMLAVPQPAFPEYQVELCGGAPVSGSADAADDPHVGARTALMVLTIIFTVLAKVAVYALGITFLDSHDPTNTALYLGIQVTIRLSMSINAERWMAGPAFGDNWVEALASMAMLIIMFSFLFTLFPTAMPGYKAPELRPADMGFLETVMRVLNNKAVVVQTFALSLLNTALWGFVKNEPDYARVRYNVASAPDWQSGWTSRAAADFLRTFIIVYCMGVFRGRFSGRRKEGVKATTASKVAAGVALVAGVLFLVLAFLRCEGAGPPRGVTGDVGVYQQPECSSHCGCNSLTYGYAPVCSLAPHETYFSPCHAGCSQVEDFNGYKVFGNCTCGGERAAAAACDVQDCHGFFAIYQLLFINALALSGGSLLMQSLAVMKAVETADRPTAVGVSFALIALVAYLPGHYIYMLVNEATCLYHRPTGECALHSERLPLALGALTAGLLVLSAVMSVVAFVVRRRDVKSVHL